MTQDVDFSDTVIPNSDRLCADDLLCGEKIITITGFKKIQGDKGNPLMVLSFEGDGGRPYIPCKMMRCIIVDKWKSKGSQYVGKKLRLFRDPDAMYAGKKVGGIRINGMSHIDKDFKATVHSSQKTTSDFFIEKLVAEKPTPKLDEQSLFDAGMKQAENGTDALRAWFESLSKDEKLAVKPRIDELKTAAESVVIDEDGVIEEEIPVI